MSANTSESVTIKYKNHSQVLIEGLWNFLNTKYRVDDVAWGGGLLKAHQLILDVFLPPERLLGSVTMSSDLHCHLEALLEFLYRGTVDVNRDNLDGLLRLAKELDFQMLVDAVAMTKNKRTLKNSPKSKQKPPWESELGKDGEGVNETRVLRPRLKLTIPSNRPWEPEVQIVAVDHGSQRARAAIRTQALKPKALTLDRLRAVVRRKQVPKRKCHDCGFETRNYAVLKSHQTVVHAKEKRFNCSQCTFTTCWKGVLQHHTVVSHEKVSKTSLNETCKREFRTRAGPTAEVAQKRKTTKVSSLGAIKKADKDRLVCSTCGKKSKTKAGLIEHRRTHTQERPYKCPHCDKRFNQTSNRSKHVKREHTACPGGFPCTVCQHVSNTHAEFKVHKRTHSQVGPEGLECEVCNKVFKSRDGLLLHRRIHAPVRRFQCPHCEKGFNQSSGLHAHVASMHTGGAAIGHFVCETCGKRLKSRASMQQHQRIHTQERPFKCPHCEKCFIQKSGLNYHITRAHTQGPDRQFLCPHCGKGFNHSSVLNYHVANMHNLSGNVGHFVCETCGKTMKTRASMQQHQRIHAQERLFKCPQCDKGFNQKSGLNSHLARAHTQGPGAFVCDTCGKRSKTRLGLIEHRRTHTQERPYKCPHCDKRFNQPSNRSKHVQKAHRQGPVSKESFVCETCGKQASSREGLTAHRRTHNAEKLHKCSQCAYAAITKQRLTAHMDVVHAVGPSRFTCEICNKRFCSRAVLLRHNLVHTKEKPFKCEHCPYATKQKATLKQHYESLHGEGSFPGGKSTHSSSLGTSHKRSRTQDKPFECPHCSYRANRKDNLTRHIDVVHGLGTGKCTCEICGKSLNSSRQLARHRRTHSKEKSNVQSEKRRSSPALEGSPSCHRVSDQQHIPSTHGPSTSGLSCEICGDRCSTLDELANHRRGHASVYPFDLVRFQSMQHL